MKKTYDILELFAALNNHEVFTPPSVARDMLDLLPIEVWSNPSLKFLDPCVKSGIFLREIKSRLFEGLKGKGIHLGFDGIEYDLDKPKERLDHIFKNMLFGIATSELTSYISRRTLYGVMEANSEKQDEALDSFMCSKNNFEWTEDQKMKFIDRMVFNEFYDRRIFDDVNYIGFEEEGNIFYPRDEVFGLIEESGNVEIEDMFYPFIRAGIEHKKIKEIIDGKRFNDITELEDEMKFDVIIGNPPYQKSALLDNGTRRAEPIYNKFIEIAIKLDPKYLTMIIPSRWFAGGRGLNSFREKMLSDKRIVKIINFENSKECFPTQDIKGGINYFLWQSDYNEKCTFIEIKDGQVCGIQEKFLNEFDIFIKDIIGIKIITKIINIETNFINKKVSSQSPFADMNARIFQNYSKEPFNKSIKFIGNKQAMIDTNGYGYVNINDIAEKNKDIVNKFKVILAKASGNGSDSQVLSIPFIIGPNIVCSETYIVISSFTKEIEAENLLKYIKTKFFRFLVSLRKNTQNSTADVYSFVPDLAMSEEWTDKKLYERYNLTQEEINYIESKIREMK